MTDSEIISTYNSVATTYNNIVSKYALCDCEVSSDYVSAYQGCVPLINTDVDVDLSIYNPFIGKINTTLTQKNIISVIESLSSSLEGMSYKEHGPEDAYYPNGYVQLYDQDNNKTTTTIDYKDNVCSDLDTLEPPPSDPEEFLENKVYPILNIDDSCAMGSKVTEAVNTFNAVAALPKKIDCRWLTLDADCTINYDETTKQDLAALGTYSNNKSSIKSKAQAIYSSFISLLEQASSAILNGDDSDTVSANLTEGLDDLEEAYTLLSDPDNPYSSPLTSLTITPSLYVSSAGSEHEVGYSKPSIIFYMKDIGSVEEWSDINQQWNVQTGAVDWENYDESKFRAVYDSQNQCTGFELQVGLRLCFVQNKTTSAIKLEGYKYTDSTGHFRLSDNLNNEATIDIQYAPESQAIIKNTAGNPTSITHTAFSLTVPACSTVSLISGLLNKVSAFPSLELDQWNLKLSTEAKYAKKLTAFWNNGGFYGYNGKLYYTGYPSLGTESYTYNIAAISYFN